VKIRRCVLQYRTVLYCSQKTETGEKAQGLFRPDCTNCTVLYLVDCLSGCDDVGRFLYSTAQYHTVHHSSGNSALHPCSPSATPRLFPAKACNVPTTRYDQLGVRCVALQVLCCTLTIAVYCIVLENKCGLGRRDLIRLHTPHATHHHARKLYRVPRDVLYKRWTCAIELASAAVPEVSFKPSRWRIIVSIFSTDCAKYIADTQVAGPHRDERGVPHSGKLSVMAPQPRPSADNPDGIDTIVEILGAGSVA
jgi:hypothetical protein